MTNNDVLRRIRYAFNLNDTKMMEIFALVDQPVSREQIRNWLEKDEAPTFEACSDVLLVMFLNGLIIERRGRKEGPQTTPEQQITNNIIFKKLKIALDLKAEDIVEIMALADAPIKKQELSAFFRKPDNKHYRECKDQLLRNFITGVQLKYRC